MPNKWITHYEKTQSSNKHVQRAEPTFKINEDGFTKIIFLKSIPMQSCLVFANMMMIYGDCLRVPIYAFNDKGQLVYESTTDGRHKWYDPAAYTCESCL